MSILSWLKDVHNHGASATKMEFAAGEEEFNGLNMKDALDAHEKWYHRLESKINGSNDEHLEVATVACDDKCVLGKWIYTSGKSNFGHMTEYDSLKQVHAEFHLTAGEVLNNALHGDKTQALAGLKNVRHKSGSVQLSLVRLYSEARS